MSTLCPVSETESDPSLSGRAFSLLMCLFVGSGCAALIYEIVWFQILQLVIGSSAVSLGILLGTYMGGMCLGSLFFANLVSSKHHPLRVYALLELGIGCLGIAILWIVPHLDQIYTAHFSTHLSVGLRAAICIVSLLIPTFFMGATLPVVSRWLETSRKGVSWLGFLYGGNIAGAVFGCLLAGFFLLRLYNIVVATCVAAALNLGVALIAWALSTRTAGSHCPAHRSEDLSRTAGTTWVFVCIALSGLTALGAEVVWTRLLSLLLGATVYTFSIILAVFLMGLGIGSSVGAAMSRRLKQPMLALGTCQMGLCAALAWSAYMLTQSIPYWPIDPTLSSNPWHNFQLDLLRCLWATLPGALLWGASFPLAVASVAASNQDMAKTVGRVYAANTTGAIVGALGFSLFIIAPLGTQGAQRLLILLAMLSAQIVWLAPLLPLRERIAWRKPVALACLCILVGVPLALTVGQIPWGLIAYGRNLPPGVGDETCLYMGEGMNASIAVTETDTERDFHVSGKVVASSDPDDMRLQLMLGHIPALFHGAPKSVLVVGCGAGVTAGAFVLHPTIERIVICEIEPLIPPAAREFFALENNAVLDDPRVEVVYDDARHFVLTTQEHFDIITSDPIHPWVKGAAALYSKEYFNMCQKRLNPGGIITQWVPLYESTPQAVKSEIATFFEALPYGTIWSNDNEGEGYDLVMLGVLAPMRIHMGDLDDRLKRPEYKDVLESLKGIRIKSALSLLGTYAGSRADLSEWLADAQINLDKNMRLQYLAGMGLNMDQTADIFDEMLTHLTFPDNIFITTNTQKTLLEYLINSRLPE
ncbi:MAG: fused MFS/spermidine synthase [Phycisphaerae bacterium]|nr:fused MFS/spermidine synthase [Phycisphaerae bacterium]